MDNPRSQADGVVTETQFEMSSSEAEELKIRAAAGDLAAIRGLINYFTFHNGDENIEVLYWQVAAARLRDCVYWQNLMFLAEEEGVNIPSGLLRGDETLASIGMDVGCGEYHPVKKIKE